MSLAITRKESAEILPSILAQFADQSVRSKEAYGELVSALNNLSAARAQSREHSPLGAILKIIGREPAVFRSEQNRFEEAAKRVKSIEQKYPSHVNLQQYVAKFPGLHGLVSTSLEYRPGDPDGLFWRTRIAISYGPGEDDVICTKVAYPELRFRTTGGRKVGDMIFVPKGERRSPILDLPAGRDMYVKIAGGPGAGAYHWAPITTRKALPVNPNDFIRQF